ncbi:hypothetical protein [Desulforhabdus sp. TSK]|uniref:hypothetical protein n=1 Tax=Desulforhabdus sp. TSK TaxID=2925014 RepID=UPI001FC85274|nr:hypothetical protein [Desulforhabdus sp. TSK]GKT09964.1 hypothetical protein DSTSK_32690 [Desulforhabdus sp. TSK]
MQEKSIRWIYGTIMAAILFNAVGPCTITHKYGPYYGKVIETQTGEPVEGAYVLLAFYTEMFTFGGFVGKFVETRDATTDKNGEFRIDAYRAWAFRFPHRWVKNCEVTIYKPGFGAFPNNASLVPEYVPFYSIPTNKHIIVSLPKLVMYRDRLNNLHSLSPVGIPDDKLRYLDRLIEVEEKDLGLGSRN